MAVNSISSSRISTPLDGIQAANQRETRANRDTQRAEQAGQAGRAEGLARSAEADRAVQNRVEKNNDAQRTRAQANDDATATQRREAEAADQRAELQRRDSGKATLGRNIDTTA
jgi:hypothetical protein